MDELIVRMLNPAVGAEISGLENRNLLDDKTIRRLREVFDDRGVLVFRDIDIDEDFQRSLVFALIGEDVPSPEDRAEKETMLVSNKEENGAAPYGRLLFHCDNMWARRPQPIISLYGLEVEQPTAPTTFVSMGHGWETLPDGLRDRVQGLVARHGFDNRYPNRGGDEDVTDTYYQESRSSVRPICFRHPRTGRLMLYVSQQATIEVLGVSAADSEDLLEMLFSHLYQPARVLQHEWRQGDLVIWDNIAVQHGRGTVRLDGPPRTLRKVTGPLNLDPDELLTPVFGKVTEN